MEPPEIERLDEQTVQRIAAGEVVERPASVVKELVENSLDAGASRVAVAVEAGGTEGIRVRDDGVGIPADQLEAAVAEHATSKIADIDDLEAGVGTLGFRGEALYTVGAVSRLTVRSRPPGADAGAEVTVEGGEVGTVRPIGCPIGTTVEVEDLFFNTPARKKFLKRVTTEFDHVNTVVSSYALANPDVAVSLEHDGRETFATEGNDDRRSAVLAVYGRPVAESMIDVEWTPGDVKWTPSDDDVPGGDDTRDGEDTDVDVDQPVRRVAGLVSHPETTRSSRDYLTTYVNGRYVTASALRESVLDAYGGQLAPDRYPFAVLFVEVPPADVDVNVHPRKLEVRFDREAAVRSAVESAVESALLDHGLIRSTAPRGQSAPDEVDVAPESPTNEVLGGAAGASGRDADDTVDAAGTAERDAADPTADAEHATGDHENSTSDRTVSTADGETTTGDAARVSDSPAEALDPAADEAWSVDGLPGDETRASKPETAGQATDTHDTTDAPGATDTPDSTRLGGANDAAEPTARSGASETTEQRGASQEQPTRRAEPTQHTLDGDETGAEREYDSLPSLRVLGQLHDTYVVAEAPDGLVLIDQHAADERVHYERLQTAFADGPAAQALAEPVTVALTAREAALFDEFLADLDAVGFRAERAGEREVTVEAVPAVFDATLDPTLLRDVLAEFVADAAAGSKADAGGAAGATDIDSDAVADAPVVADAIDELLADLACYPSITGNTSLTDGRVVDLLDRLDDCSNPYACPHGRPVVIRLDHDELGARFERDYPGHAGRRSE
jgi:DNA mismatch repair protein MutL